MLILGFVEMSHLMLNLFLTSAIAVKVCFLCLGVFCYKWLIMEGIIRDINNIARIIVYCNDL